MEKCNYKIGKNLKLGNNVKIGDFTIIGDNVKIGDGTIIGAHTVISDGTYIGNGNRIGNFCSIGCDPSYRNLNLDLKSYVTIGDNNLILDFAVVTRASIAETATIIGNDCIIASHCYIGHDCIVANKVFFSTKSMLAGNCSVGDCSTIGAGSFIHQNSVIGELCMIGACAKVVRDVPSYLLVDGSPAEVKKINRIGLERNQQEFLYDDIRAFYNNYYGVSRNNDLEFVNNETIIKIQELIRKSKRGITRCLLSEIC